MKTYRVLQFGMTYNPGGIESFIMNYYRHIDRQKIQFDFVNMYDEIAYENEINLLGGKVYNITSFRSNPVKNYLEIRKIIKNNKYDIIHVNMLSMAYITPILVAKDLGVKKIIAHSHNSSMPPNLFKKILHKVNQIFFNKYITQFCACSKDAGKWMFGDSVLEENIHIINNAVDTLHFTYNEIKREEIRLKLGINDKFVIGNVARFDYQKNHNFLIDIFFEVQQENENAILLLVGDGPLRKSIEEKVAKLSIQDKVIFLGVREDIADLMQVMDVFLLPSYFEGLAVVLIEAQASGLITICSDSIPNEVNVSNSVEFLKLELGSRYWAKLINNLEGKYCRYDICKKTNLSNFNIKEQVTVLEKIYTE